MKLLLCSTLIFLVACGSRAAVTEVHLFELGELGSISADLVQDSVGGEHFTGGNSLGPTYASPSPISSYYSRFDGADDYQYGADFSALTVDNYAVELWVRASDVNQSTGLFSTGKNTTGNLRFHLNNGNWAASYRGGGWIGAVAGTGQTASTNKWTHLAVVRDDGISTFYIDGIAQSGPSINVPSHSNNGHLGVFNGGTPFAGDIDNIRIFTFDPLTDDPVSNLALRTKLSIQVDQGAGNAVLSWPRLASTNPFYLEATTNLVEECWSAVAGDSALTGDIYEQTTALSGQERFFRLDSVVTSEVFGAFSELRLNEVQYIGTHNSYHIAPGASMSNLMVLAEFGENGWSAELLYQAIDLTHPSLTVQLDSGLRQFELDVYADPTGGRFSNPGALDLMADLGLSPDFVLDPDGNLGEPGFKVLHKPEYDFRSNSYLLTNNLHEIQTWSEANPNHFPIIIHIQVKESNGGAITNGYGPTVVDEFDDNTWQQLESDIQSVFPAGQIITPDDVRGSYLTLNGAIMTEGWPKLKDLRGKVLFFLLNDTDTTLSYMPWNSNLQGRLLFANLGTGHHSSAWIVDPDPYDPNIPSYLNMGYLVTVQADSNTWEARANSTARRDKSFSVGAQFILTDYPVPDERFSDYQVVFEYGDYVRPNPVTQ